MFDQYDSYQMNWIVLKREKRVIKFKMYLNASAMSTSSNSSKKFLLIASYTLTSFRLKYDKWAKMTESGVAKGTILSWLDNEFRRSLFFFVDTMGELVPSLTLEPMRNKFIQQTEGKFVFFLKRSPVTIQVENFRSDVIFGDAPVNAAHNFPIYLSEVFLVLLRCPLNLQSSPETIFTDVKAQVCNLQSSFSEVAGNNAKSWNNLFATIDMSLIMKAAHDIQHGNTSSSLNPKERNELEGGTIKLIEQIHKRLNDSPLSLSTVQPENEIQFWNTRLSNLENIYEQLHTPLIKAVGNILADNRSAYADVFHQVVKDVELALHEASDITLYLNPILEQMLQFRKVCFINAGPLIRPLVHVIFLVFWNSKFYTTRQRTTTLLRAHCNLLALKAVDDMEISLLFQNEPQEAYAKLAKTIEIIKQFKKHVLEYQEKGACTGTENFRPLKLLFHTQDVFADVDMLLNQFTDFLQVFSIADSFKSLEKVEIGGLHGRVVAVQLVKINQEHDKLLEKVAADSAEIFTRRNEKRSLSKTISNYLQMTTSLEKKLATIVAYVFQKCADTELYMKLLHMTSKLFDLPTLKQDMQPVVTQMFSLWIEELAQVKISLEKMVSGQILSEKQMPPTISRIIHIRRYQNKIHQLMKIEVELGRTMRLFDLDLSDYVNQCQQYLTDLLRLQNELLQKWIKSTEENLTMNLNKTILAFDLLKRIQVNFTDSLDRGIRESKYILDVGFDIPMSLKEVHLKRTEIWLRKCRVTQIAEWYNDAQESPSCVFSLVKDEFDGIHKRIDETFHLITWNDYDDASVNDIFAALKSLNQRMTTAKNQTDGLIKEIRLWLHQQFYQRNITGSGISLIENIKIISASNFEQCNVIRNRILDVITQNFKMLYKDLNEMDHTNVEVDVFTKYKLYVCQMVETEITQGIKKSLNCMQKQTDSSEEQILPLFQVNVILDCGQVAFRPSLGSEEHESFFDIILQLIRNIVQTIQAVPVAEEIGVEKCVKSILKNTRTAMISSMNWASQFEKYEILWKNDAQVNLKVIVGQCQSLDGNLTSQIEETLPKFLDEVKMQVDFYSDLYEELETLEKERTFGGFLLVSAKAAKQEILNYVCKQANIFKGSLRMEVIKFLMKLETFVTDGLNSLNAGIDKEDFEKLYEIMNVLNQLENVGSSLDNTLKPLKEAAVFLNMWNVSLPETSSRLLEELSSKWSLLKKVTDKTLYRISPAIDFQRDITRKRINLFLARLQGYYTEFLSLPIFKSSCQNVYNECDRVYNELFEFSKELHILKKSAALFNMTFPNDIQLKNCQKDLKCIKQVWDFVLAIESCIKKWKATAWIIIDTEEVENECKKFFKELRSLDKSVRTFQPYADVERDLKHLMVSLRTTAQLQNKAITDRHWMDLITATKLYKAQPIQCLMSYKTDETATFEQILSLNLNRFEEEVSAVVERAIKELSVSNILSEIHSKWTKAEFECDVHDRRNIQLPKVSEEFIESLEESQLQLQMASSSKHTDYIMPQIRIWQEKLSAIDQVVGLWLEVQRKWIYLENIFIGSDGICVEIPQNSSHRFEAIDQSFIEIVDEMIASLKVLRIIENHEMCRKFETLLQNLNLCEKALNNYLETKRLAFPRFYFISSADLLDILANGNNPSLVVRHLIKLFDSVAGLSFQGNSKLAISMTSKENSELVNFYEPCDCSGKVEIWLNSLINCMRTTIQTLFQKSLAEFHRKEREHWLRDWPAQVALCCEQINWTSSVENAFALQHEGYENAMKEFHRKQISSLNSLISLLSGDLTPGSRQKIMTICTISVHCRDFVAKVIQIKLESASSFQWQSQLRHRWDTLKTDCYANICDAEFLYAYEYLGNTPRLVVTPLTDRCYITLTQSLRLVLGGAPAGPAGTGKTETIKDLGRALGVIVYVFNCSEQMDYKSCGNIYKGLAQTGAWGCFDEFNRIAVEVLSVIAIQVKTIQDAIKANQVSRMTFILLLTTPRCMSECSREPLIICFQIKYLGVVENQCLRWDAHADFVANKKAFIFMKNTIRLEPSVGIFVTMNPGYAGRTELPENLKSLFRPCAMFVADFALICEIMLVAEGFQEARFLARKFITLYDLCREILSKQDHYDWGLRAIKSVLVVAGSLKRNDANLPEELVLMRALRDFNVPKLVTDDVLIFCGLFNDLFPISEVPRKRSCGLEEAIRRAAISLKLQPNESFTLKVTQLQELLDVRHCLFVVGSAGSGKTRIWQTLFTAYKLQQLKPHYDVLNPKAVSNDELFGCVNATTREWKDGLLSVIMRDQANMNENGPKWVVLDGDIDPIWIENLNTVMDDNKVLTLANNERITLKKEMRLLFEVGHLEAATPATVSRAGVLYINRQDLGWLAIVASWLETRNNPVEKAALRILFEKYFPIVVPKLKCFQRVTVTTDVTTVQMICQILECLLDKAHPSDKNMEQTCEIYLNFSIVWGVGSNLLQDHVIDWRKEFHKWYTAEFKSVQFLLNGTVFDYCIDFRTNQFSPWNNIIQSFEVDSDKPLTDVIIPTTETTRNAFILKLLMLKGYPVLLVGNSGTGKNTLLKILFKELREQIVVKKAHFNFYTTANSFQTMLDKPLEKISGKTFGPGRNKNLVYFINDFNMAEVDAYGTVQVHTVVRQFMDYRQWYDKSKLILKDIRNCQFVACMNPNAGSFTIDPRLQRHFFVLAVNHLNDDMLRNIYLSIFRQHIESSQFNFTKEVQAIAETLVSAGIALQRRVENTFLPTAVKYHHIFNMRDMTNIFQGLLLTRSSSCPKPNDLIRFYVHEAQRVYGDRFMESNDVKSFNAIIKDTFKKYVEDLDEEYVFAEPMIFCHFSQSLLDQKYTAVKSWNQLLGLLSEAQRGYSESIGHINLVLFEDAIKHICRINRVLESPHGNALLIGVGGSGKQTLSRLAAFISSLTTFQLQLKRGYCLQDMRTDIAELYMKVGIKNVWTMFLLSDSYILDETHLTFISDILASGEIPDLFDEDQIDSIMNGVRNELKQLNIADDRESCYKFFIEKVRRMLKIVLCFSPAGATLRTRVRQFPVIINKTYIDWFHEWPKAALESVSQKFLSEIDILPTQLISPVSSYMAYVHQTVNLMSKTFLQNERRYNYTTPKTFLEYIALYSKLLTSKTKEIIGRIDRLQSGMAKLADCTKQVDTLQDELAKQLTLLNAKNEAADKLIVLVGAESEKVKREKMVVSEEERRVRVIEEDITIKTKLCEDDLRRAEPALLAAQAALNTLNKTNLTELKSFGSPPRAVINVCAAVMVLLAPSGRVPRDRGWRSAKLMMGKVDQFLNDLVNYDKDNIPPNVIEALEEYLKDPEFNPEKIVQKSVAAAGLCAWTINLYKYHQVFQVVGPKQQALESSQQKLNEARARLKFLKAKIDELEHKLSAIQLEFTAALNEKQKCEKVADKTSATISLAHRLVNGLGNENVRWRELIFSLEENVSALPGDALLISSFLSYVGSFTRAYREELYNKLWMPVFSSIEPTIPYTPNVEPLNLICDEAQIALWHNEGLPRDHMSIENAAILTNSSRWPLIIDPQMQGIKWIKNKYSTELVVLHLTRKGFLEKLETSMARGDIVLIEYIEETIDSILEPLLSRTLIKKGHFIRIGDKEMDYNPQFKLILHTKLANPHFKPEIQAHTTLINFTVTKDGLQDQLLAEVIKAERSDLEEEKTELTIQQNSFRIALKNLEDELLVCLATAKKSILDDRTLVENLEATKKTVIEMESKVKETKIATKKIDESRNHYRPAAHRASILYFVLADLQRINPLYVFSLKSFISVFKRALSVPDQTHNLEERVISLVKSITYEISRYTLRGLFEKDKLTFVSQMSLQILISSARVSKEEIDFLLRYPSDQNAMSPLGFISSSAWGGIKSLSMVEGFFGLDSDIEEFPRRWRHFVENEFPEKMTLPGEWKSRTPLQKLCIIRCLRPERICHFFREFNKEVLGSQYGSHARVPFYETFAETNASTPIFFILSPGVHPLSDVKKHGKALKMTHERGNFHNISLGQDQELLAENHLQLAMNSGHWVILQNVHLVSKWLPRLEKFVENLSDSSHPAFRLIITAEPAAHIECHIIPKGILEPSLKIVEEPPSGVSENFHRALDNVSQDIFDDSPHESEMKCILFSLCYFHAVIVERRKFQTLGWNNSYPFNYGDLSICADILRNYLSENNQIPWEDLRYLFGEIIYGGHITDNWDRRLCQTYLEEFIQQDLVDGDFYLCPDFRVPPSIDFSKRHEYVTEHLPQETPSLYGLAANAEIALLSSTSELLLKTLLELQPTDSTVTSSSCTQPREELVRIIAVDTLDRLQDEFNMSDFAKKVKKSSPYIAVAMQECERMNLLIKEIRRSLKELLLSLKGELTMTAEMEDLQDGLFYENIPKRWAKLAYPSLLSFHPWFQDFTLRIRELQSWCSDFTLPSSIWLGGLFNPQSFLTAIMQESARKTRLPLDNMCLYTNVTKKFKDDVSAPPAEGALLHGLFLEGAGWDCNLNSIVSLHRRELATAMPLILAKATSQEKVSFDDVYQCPVYKTRIRGQTYVWCFDLKTRARPSKWILGGVALLLQVS